jgi:G3E family GTPase
MPATPEKLQAIPTNIITGFLGVGKTTAILHLLKHKPQDERWAVLVNEFGEVGIDGSILAGSNTKDGDVFVREVPGGCMCCAAGLPMQIALNRLLSKARPHRVLIEPTGLGHPAEIIALLRSEFYRPVLDLRATLTLLDTQRFGDPRYAENATFQQQLEIADVLVANKSDIAEPGQADNLQRYCNIHYPQKPLYFSRFAQLDPLWLDLSNHSSIAPSTAQTPVFASVDLPQALPECGFVQMDNRADDYFSSGWIFNADFVFDYAALFALLSGATEERLKGVFITDRGIYAFNKNGDILTEIELDDAQDTRIEIIHAHAIDSPLWQSRLLAACCGLPLQPHESTIQSYT